MATAFEQFVNTEIPKRLSIDVPVTGNLDADKMVVTTGTGLGVKLLPIGGSTPSSVTKVRLMVDGAMEANQYIVLNNPPIEGTTVVFLNGLNLVNYLNSDFTVSGSQVAFTAQQPITTGDTILVEYQT